MTDFVDDKLSPVPSLIPARILNEFAYCPRLAYLEWVQGEFEESADTLEGTHQHRRVNQETGEIPGAEKLSSPDTGAGQTKTDLNAEEYGGLDEQREPLPLLHARSLLLSAPAEGLVARLDLLELDGPVATPIDYKRGKAPEVPEGAWEPERLQLCAQGLILRENGYECSGGVIYYVGSKTRVWVEFSDELVAKTRAATRALRDLATRGHIPPPLTDSPKCFRCSLVGICLPDEINHLAERSPSEEKTVDVRRLMPARHETLPVYVLEQGSMVGKRGDVLEIRQGGELLNEVKLLDVSQVCLFGNVQVTTQALRELLMRNIAVCYYTYGGWFYGLSTGMSHKNVELRLRQYEAASRLDISLELARRFVVGKIKNARTLLRRNHPNPAEGVLAELNQWLGKAKTARDLETLLGIEGMAARAYFSHFQGMLKGSAAGTFDFTGRNRRPPRDPVNALLSFVYSLLVKDLTITVLAVGFDPYLGFYHQPRYGRPALALDLAEEFRPLVGESVVLGLLNQGEVRSEDFLHRAGAVSLTPRGRRKVIAAYERRLDGLVTHPTFGYAVSYRRIFEIQARLLARYLSGEIPAYPPFTTR